MLVIVLPAHRLSMRSQQQIDAQPHHDQAADQLEPAPFFFLKAVLAERDDTAL